MQYRFLELRKLMFFSKSLIQNAYHVDCLSKISFTDNHHYVK